MQPPAGLKKIPIFFSTLLSKIKVNRPVFLLAFFLIIVLLVSFIIPQLTFGRFYGSDAYSHLQSTNIMASSRGLYEFYQYVADRSEDPSDPGSGMDYPFGLWLIGATLAKITGLFSINASFFFITFYFLVIVGSFYLYTSTWLKSREQKICAVLFLLCMPEFSIICMNYSPNVFVLPFIFMLFYIIFKEPVDWRLLPIALLSIFIIIISHAGTFVFLLGFLLAFFLFYCLFWGKFSKPVYVAIVSVLFVYIISLTMFPHIVFQYQYTSRKFLLPGNFLADTFNFTLPGDIIGVFYTNLLAEYQIAFAVISAALLFTIGQLFLYIHRKTTHFLSQNNNLPAFILPVSNLSHSVTASPFWIGPVHVIFSVPGFFHLDNKGR